MRNFDILDQIMEYEDGKLDGEDTLRLFAYLIRTGQAWTLQGHYGRTAARLIAHGAIDREGQVLVNASGERL